MNKAEVFFACLAIVFSATSSALLVQASVRESTINAQAETIEVCRQFVDGM